MKKYTVIGLIQSLIVILFSIAIFFMFKIEKIILNPIPYSLGLAIPIIILDSIILIYLFKKYEHENENTEIANS